VTSEKNRSSRLFAADRRAQLIEVGRGFDREIDDIVGRIVDAI